MRTYNILLKLLGLICILVLFWQTLKLLPSVTDKNEIEKLVEKEQSTQKILVTVFYEALCPDSRSFIKHQLKPTFNQIEDYIQLKLVPYGKAETKKVNNDYEFKCQHGEIECEANIIHACAINHVQDSRRQLELVECMISNNLHPTAILDTCANGMIEYKNIIKCSRSLEGRKLLSLYGEITKVWLSKISFIPTITLDNDIDNQILILKNLLRQVCQRLDSPPEQCKS